MAPRDKPVTASQGEALSDQLLVAQNEKEKEARKAKAKAKAQALEIPKASETAPARVPAPASAQPPLPAAGNGQSTPRDVLPPNFIQAIAELTVSTNTLTTTYTTSLNHLIEAVKEVQRLSKNARSQNAKLIKSIQITQGKSEEVNEKTIKSLSLLIGKYVKEPDKKRSIKERFLEDTIEGQIFNSNIVRKLTRRRSQEQEKADAEKAEAEKKTDSDTNVNVNTDAQKETATFVKSKNDKIAAPNSDVDADENVKTAAEALKNTPLQPVKVMEYGDRAIDQLRLLFKTYINVNPKLAGKYDADSTDDNSGGGGGGLLGLLGAGGLGAGATYASTTAAKSAAESAGRRSTVAAAKRLKFAGKVAGPLAAAITVAEGATTAYGGYTDAAEQVKSGEITKDEGTVKKSQAIGTGTGQAAGGLTGAYAGGIAGAQLGVIGGPIGIAVGGFIGAAVGAWLGSSGGEIVGKTVGTAVGKTIIEKPVVAEPIKKSLTPPASMIKSNVEATGLEVATPVATPVADKPLSPLAPVKPAQAADSSNTGKVGGSADVGINGDYQYNQQQFIASNLSLRAIAENPDDYKAAEPKRQDPFAATIEAAKFSPAAKSMVQPIVKPSPAVNLAPAVTSNTTSSLKPAAEITTFRAAAVTMPLPVNSKSLTTNVDQSTPKTKSTDGFTNFVAPKSIPFTNNNAPANSDKAAASQYNITAARGEPDYIKKPGTLLGDRFGNNAQALPVPSLISLIPPVTSTESSINPNIIELNQSMRGLAAAFAKRSPDTESDGTTSISSNNSSVNNTNNSFGDSVERDVIYMDRNKTRKQNAYRGDFF